MALAGTRQVVIGETEDGAFAVQREVIVDPSTGRAAAVEKVTVAVPTEDGNIAIMQQQRVRIVDTGTTGYPQRAAITAPGYGSTRPQSGQGDDTEVNYCLYCCICLFCCVFCFPCWIVWLVLNGVSNSTANRR